MKRVYIKIKTTEMYVPVFGNLMAKAVAGVAHKIGKKLDVMFYQVYILED